MNESQMLCLIFGPVSVLLGIAIIFVKVDRSKLANKVHSAPGLALFRFPAWRWGVALVCISTGFLLLLSGIGWLDI